MSVSPSFSHYPPPPSSYAPAIAMRAGSGELAHELLFGLFGAMRRSGVAPNERSIGVAVPMCGRAKQHGAIPWPLAARKCPC